MSTNRIRKQFRQPTDAAREATKMLLDKAMTPDVTHLLIHYMPFEAIKTWPKGVEPIIGRDTESDWTGNTVRSFLDAELSELGDVAGTHETRTKIACDEDALDKYTDIIAQRSFIAKEMAGDKFAVAKLSNLVIDLEVFSKGGTAPDSNTLRDGLKILKARSDHAAEVANRFIELQSSSDYLEGGAAKKIAHDMVLEKSYPDILTPEDRQTCEGLVDGIIPLLRDYPVGTEGKTSSANIIALDQVLLNIKKYGVNKANQAEVLTDQLMKIINGLQILPDHYREQAETPKEGYNELSNAQSNYDEIILGIETIAKLLGHNISTNQMGGPG